MYCTDAMNGRQSERWETEVKGRKCTRSMGRGIVARLPDITIFCVWKKIGLLDPEQVAFCLIQQIYDIFDTQENVHDVLFVAVR